MQVNTQYQQTYLHVHTHKQIDSNLVTDGNI